MGIRASGPEGPDYRVLLSNCVNGFSRLDSLLDDQDLWSALGQASSSVANKMNPQDVANSVDGFSKVPFLRDGSMWDGLVEATIKTSPEMKGRGLRSCIVAFDAMDFKEPRLWKALAPQLRKFLREFSRGDLLSVLRAYSEAKVPDPALWEALANVLGQSGLSRLPDTSLERLIIGLSEAEGGGPKLWVTLSWEAVRRRTLTDYAVKTCLRALERIK